MCREVSTIQSKKKICRQKEKNNVVPLPKDKMLFNSKCKHRKTKNSFKKNPTLSIQLASQLSENLGKNTDNQKRLLLPVHPGHKTFFALQIITSEAIWQFFAPAPPFLITNALLVLPIGYTPHLVCDHQLLNVSEELYSTDLCQ